MAKLVEKGQDEGTAAGKVMLGEKDGGGGENEFLRKKRKQAWEITRAAIKAFRLRSGKAFDRACHKN